MYRVAATLLGLSNVAVGLIWIFNPVFFLILWCVSITSKTLMVEHRLGVMLFAIGIVLLLVSDLKPSIVRSAISYGVIVGALMMASMAIYDLLAGSDKSGIVPGIGTNVLIAGAFAALEWRAHREGKKEVAT